MAADLTGHDVGLIGTVGGPYLLDSPAVGNPLPGSHPGLLSGLGESTQSMHRIHRQGMQSLQQTFESATRQAVESGQAQEGSDSRLEHCIHVALDDDPATAAADIQATVKDGTVTLTGTVRNRRAKQAASMIGWSCPGVWDVRNEIEIRGRSQPQPAPGSIQRETVRRQRGSRP